MKSFFVALFMSACCLLAAGPATWELSQYAEFSKGRLRGVSLTREGLLVPGLSMSGSPVATGEASLWTGLAGPGESVYLGTGPAGRIFQWKPGSAAATSLGSPAPGHVFALALDPQGALYAGVSPGGRIYRRSGEAWQLYAETGAKFVWALAFGADGALYAATGDEGKLWRIQAGKPELWWESGQLNLTALSRREDGTLLVGSDPNGMLFQVLAKGKARVLYDAPFAEIRSIASGPDGQIHFLGMGGVAAKRGPAVSQSGGAAGTGTVPQVTTSITVTEEAAQVGIDLKPKSAAPAQTPTSVSTVPSALEIPGLDRAGIFRLNANLTVDQIYTTKEESIFDIAWRSGQLYFATDGQGRVYRLEADRQATLALESQESDLARLLPTANGWIALATTAGRMIRIDPANSPQGEYVSPVHEAASISTWGALEWNGTAELRFETRSGNSVKPDGTWSEWEPLKGKQVSSPAGKYLQWRFLSKGDFALRSVTVYYLPRNQAPQVKSVVASLSVTSQKAPSTTATPAAGAVYSLTVTDTGEAGAATSSGTSALLPTRPLLRQMLLTWTSEDPDSDILEYRLEYRAEDESRWKLLKENLYETSYAVDADTLADSRYFFRVTARDAPSNTLDSALESSLTSVPVILDQTAPRIELNLNAERLEVQVSDELSAIRRVEYSLNGGPWRGLSSTDGMLDSRSETARLRLGQLTLTSGENVLSVRAFDAALNVAVRKIKLQK